MNILQEIFTDHYEEIKYTLHPRPAEMENIDKMINCGDPSYGGAMYGCIHCGNLKFVPFRCHSRFCPTCGNKYSMDRTTSMSFKLVNVRHRHCVFTIDASLRDFFLQDRSLLNCLFHSVSSVVLRLFSKMNKHKNFTPGFIMVLHTFGRDLKWNPHIHCLISEGGYSDDAFWRNVSHFNYTFLRNAFRTALLKEMLLFASVLLLKKFLPVVIWNMNTALCLSNPTVVTLDILVALSLPLPGSILIPVILSLSITIVTKMINTFKKPFLSWILSNSLSGTSLKNISR